MTSTPPALARYAAVILFGIMFGLAAGCASDDGRPHRAGGKVREVFPTLAGHADFFQGRLTAEVRVGAMTGFDLHDPDGGDGSGGGHPRGGGMGRRHGGGGGGGGGMGMPRGERPSDGAEEAAAGQSSMARRAANGGSPPVMIHLRFVNHGTEKADVVITDFLSPLGNFVVQPEKFPLQPGEALAVEPMTSRLAGEISDGEISLSLKLGDATETKTIALELQPEAAATTEPPPQR